MSEMDLERKNMEDVKGQIEKYGVSGIEKFLKAKLEGWKDVIINIAVTGNSGVGKSSFINTIRELEDGDEDSAQTGVTETTRDVAVYSHPTNDKINFWDLPGIGTPNYPDLETYVEKVGLEKYNTFLIFTASRFTQNDLDLAKKVKSINKSFFFIRTKIDQDYRNEKRKKRSKKAAFDEEAMLQKIKKNCLENLKGLGDVVFLISNHHPDGWEFPSLRKAILDALPNIQKECLTLSLTSRSKDMLKRKVEILRGRICMIAAASAVGAFILLPGLSVAVDTVLIMTEMKLYRSQLGLPGENDSRYRKLTPENKEKIRILCVINAAQLASLFKKYATGSAVEEFVRFIPFVGLAIAGGISFASTYRFLSQYLKDLEETALSFMDDSSKYLLNSFESRDSDAKEASVEEEIQHASLLSKIEKMAVAIVIVSLIAYLINLII